MMISGIFSKSRCIEKCLKVTINLNDPIIHIPEFYLRTLFRDDSLIVFSAGRTADYKNGALSAAENERFLIVFVGRIYSREEGFKNGAGGGEIDGKSQSPAQLFLDWIDEFGPGFVSRLNAKFSFIIWDKARKELVFGRDRFGIEPLYYYSDAERLVFSSSIPLLFSIAEIEKKLSYRALSNFLLSGYNPGLETIFSRVFKVRPAHTATATAVAEELNFSRYWQLQFEAAEGSASEIADRLKGHLERAIAARCGHGFRTGVFLSGGLDSSTVLAFAGKHLDHGIDTFSYRCLSESFDESHYARFMAGSAGSRHHEIPFDPGSVLLMPKIVEEMNEPFCDLGINIATYLLGMAAQERVSHILTGDGGDELFGGHPIYEADKIAVYFDRAPVFLKSPVFKLLSLLPDSDQKKNLTVKLKRFAENIRLPAGLLSHRWRIYYHPEELKQLYNREMQGCWQSGELFEDILAYSKEASGYDLLSRSLYCDYHTVVDFYLRRNDLTRHLGLETHFPLLDHQLVEFCAQIPSSLKIKGWFDTKYILKKAVAGVLPERILYRDDKLGHSIPMKNWMRGDKKVKEFLLDYLSQEQLAKRGIFDKGAVLNLLKDHLSMRRNNSHRLWCLAVLEMWMQAHIDA